jgi:hypothetical protein
MNQVSCEAALVSRSKINVTESTVANMVRNHVIAYHQEFMGHGCPLVFAPSFETVKSVSQANALGFRCRVGRLHRRRLQLLAALGDAAAFPLSGGFAGGLWHSSRRRRRAAMFQAALVNYNRANSG